MKDKTVATATLAATLLAACASTQTVHLIDGRVLHPNRIVSDGRRVQFAVNGWEYNLPSQMTNSDSHVPPATLQKITITKDSIGTPEQHLSNFDDLIHYIDKNASQASPILLILPDSPSWPESRRQSFGTTYGEASGRPDVGIEDYWPRTWLPGEPGRELAK